MRVVLSWHFNLLNCMMFWECHWYGSLKFHFILGQATPTWCQGWWIEDQHHSDPMELGHVQEPPSHALHGLADPDGRHRHLRERDHRARHPRANPRGLRPQGARVPPPPHCTFLRRMGLSLLPGMLRSATAPTLATCKLHMWANIFKRYILLLQKYIVLSFLRNWSIKINQTEISGEVAEDFAAKGGGETVDEEGWRLRVVLPRADNRVVDESAQPILQGKEGERGLGNRFSQPQTGRVESALLSTMQPIVASYLIYSTRSWPI